MTQFELLLAVATVLAIAAVTRQLDLALPAAPMCAQPMPVVTGVVS